MSLEHRVSIDWNNNGSFADADENISEYVQSVDANRGITDPLARVADVGSMTITVYNGDKRFSPAYSAGPLFGKLKPGLPVKVELVDGASTYPIFKGITRAFRPEPGERGNRQAFIDCGDVLQQLQDHTLSIPLQTGRDMQYVTKMILANTLRGGLASGRFDFSAQPANSDHIFINGYVFMFVTTVSAPNHVKIGANLEATIDNFAAAVNGGPGAGSLYGTGTLRPPGAVAEPNRTYFREVMQEGSLRYYRLGETGTSTIVDRGINGRNGTLNFTPGFIPGAMPNDPDGSMGFDGVGYFANLPSIDLDNRDFFIECWIYPYNFSIPASQVFFSAHSAQLPGQSVHMRVLSNGSLYVGFWGNDFQTAAGVVPFGAWTHVALNYHYGTDTCTLFINGLPYTSNSVGPFVGKSPLVELGRSFGGSEYWNGAIDEFALGWRNLTSERIATHHTARNTATGITVYANARGSWGNSITLTVGAGPITTTGAALTGGTDGPAGLLDSEPGMSTFDVAGDQWVAGSTSGLDALTDVMETERGLLWVNASGKLVVRNRDWEFAHANDAPDVVISSDHNGLEFVEDAELLFNRVAVTFTPRGALASGTVARSRGLITVPGKAGNQRWSPGKDLDPSTYPNPGGGLIVQSIPFVEPGTGKIVGAKSLTLPPRPGTDFTAGDKEDGTNSTSYDYTHYSGLRMSVAETGSSIEVSFENDAIGPLVVKDFKLDGMALVAYEPQTAIVEDSASMDAYGRREFSLELPLTGDAEFARALAQYVLNRHRQPAPRISRISYANDMLVNGVNLLSLDVGALLDITDAQTGIVAHSYMITGFEYVIQAGPPVAVGLTLQVRRIDDSRFAIFGDGSLSLPDGSNNFSL